MIVVGGTVFIGSGCWVGGDLTEMPPRADRFGGSRHPIGPNHLIAGVNLIGIGLVGPTGQL